VATDIAARGIDVDGISHVVNFDLPNVPETYVHRIGRTARAGAEGIAISLCDGEEVAFLRDIEKLIRISIPLTDRRSNPGKSEAMPADRPTSRPHAHAKDTRRQWRRGNRPKRDHRQQKSGENTGGIDTVGFLKGHTAPRRDHGKRQQHWAGQSKGQ
jgi:ATP-dependent RNA helicase RhlE